MNARTVIKRLEKRLSAWCSDSFNEEFMARESHQAIVSAARQRDPWQLLGPLDKYCTWLAANGALSVLQGENAGWASVHDVVSTRAWSLRLAYERYCRAQLEGRELGIVDVANTVALAMLHAMAAGFPPACAGLWGMAIDSTRNGAFGRWDLSPLEPFALHVGARFNESLAVPIQPSDPYRELLAGWRDDRFSDLLAKCCDFHLMRVDDGPNFPPFVTIPYNLFPVEILGAVRVRRAQGIETTLPQHPLLATPLARPVPSQSVIPGDPTCRTAVELIQDTLRESP